MEEIEQIQQDANHAEPSEPQNQDAEQGRQEQNVAAQEKQPAQEMPFHEHPRFKELVEQKNRYQEQARTLEESYRSLESQVKKLQEGSLSQKQEDALIARLKGIDPEFGDRFEKQDAALRELEELKQWKAQVEQDRVRSTAVATVNQLHEQNKIPPSLRDLYNEQLEAAYSRSPQAFLKDVSSSYKAVHDRMSKLLEDVKRSERESYVSTKKADASIPSSGKGKSVPTDKSFKFSEDPEQAKAQIVKRTLELMRAERE